MKAIDSTVIESTLWEALRERGFYNPHNVFHHQPEFYAEPEGSKYKYKIEVVKWNTSSAGVTKLGARWDVSRKKWILSTYKQGSVLRMKHGEKMR